MEELSSKGFGAFFQNPIFLSAIFSWFFAQFVKTLIVLFKPAHMSFKYYISVLLWRTGGMPSSHSALVSAITTAVGFREGFDSSLFIAFLGYGLLVVRDAVGVRRSAGIQARTLNKMGLELQEKLGISYKPVKEISGHSAVEVLIGIILGFFIALAFALL